MSDMCAHADAAAITRLFNERFGQRLQTRLCGNAPEPLYQPADENCAHHRLHFRADYAASALHEIAHWCIAGPARRQLLDYGYWYQPDGRDNQYQRQFEAVEARPQALEWLFSQAAGLPFRLSIDNLDAEADIDPFPFALAVWQALQTYLHRGLPPRAADFRDSLARTFGGPLSLRSEDYLLEQLKG